MKRLTVMDESGRAYCHEPVCGLFQPRCGEYYACEECDIPGRMQDKLAAYEDISPDPAHIRAELDKIVRCGECREYWMWKWIGGEYGTIVYKNPDDPFQEDMDGYTCRITHCDMGPDGFCSRGVRKKAKEDDK